MNQKDLAAYCDRFLTIEEFKDYCPNGLQVEGDNREIERIALGVSMSLELIEKALSWGADLIITHHGLIWNNDDRRILGPFREKVRQLLTSGVAAIAYHLPLDFHSEVGNNIQLAQHLGLKDIQGISPAGRVTEAVMGITSDTTINQLAKRVEVLLQRPPVLLPYGPEVIQHVAIMTGAAQDFFLKAVEHGADCFLTGEVSERNFAMSKEYGVHFIGAGHYATETFGIRALGKHLTETLGLVCEFIDIPNPI